MPSVTYLLGDLIVDYAQRRMTVAGVPVKLTVIKYRLLADPSANTSLIVTLRASAATGLVYWESSRKPWAWSTPVVRWTQDFGQVAKIGSCS